MENERGEKMKSEEKKPYLTTKNLTPENQ